MLTQSSAGAQYNAIPQRAAKTPKTKEDLLDHVVFGANAEIKRLKAHVAEILFPDTQQKFLLTVHKPRGPRAKVDGNGSGTAHGRSRRRSSARGSRARH